MVTSTGAALFSSFLCNQEGICNASFVVFMVMKVKVVAF